MEFVSQIISGIVLVIVTLIEVRANKERKEYKLDQERRERRAATRAEESQLAMKMQDANLELGLATAIALQSGKTNGELKAAKKKAQEVQCEYEDFKSRVVSQQLAKR